MGMTNVGFAEAAGLLGNTGSPTAFTYLAVGSGTTAAAATDTTLGTEITTVGLGRASATVSRVTTSVTNDTLQLTKTWTATGSATVAEVGILNAASGGTLLARSVLGSSRSIVSGDSYTLTYKVAFS